MLVIFLNQMRVKVMNKQELLEDLGRIVTRIRKKKFMTQASLGAASESSQMTIQRIESGNGGGMRLETLFGIAGALSIPLADIFLELERPKEDLGESSLGRFESTMKQLSPSKKEWIAEIALKILEQKLEEA